MKMDVYVEDKQPIGDASYRYEATAYLPTEVSRARAVFVGRSDDSGARAYRELLTGLLDLKLVGGEHDLTVVHDETTEAEARDRGTARGAEKPEEAKGPDSIPLSVLREAIVKETAGGILAYVVAVRDDKGEAWQTKDEAEGAAEGLWALARAAGARLDPDELGAEARLKLREETARLLSEAPRTLRKIREKAQRDGHASLTLDDDVLRSSAEEALRYGPHVLRYLAGEEVEPA